MPSRNVRKEYVSNSYYHIYSRGGNKQKLFLESVDYEHFLGLFERYFSEQSVIGKNAKSIRYIHLNPRLWQRYRYSI